MHQVRPEEPEQLTPEGHPAKAGSYPPLCAGWLNFTRVQQRQHMLPALASAPSACL